MKGILKGVFIILVILGLVRTFENYAIIDDVSNYYHETLLKRLINFNIILSKLNRCPLLISSKPMLTFDTSFN